MYCFLVRINKKKGVELIETKLISESILKTVQLTARQAIQTIQPY
jgi:hypothetical protein